MEQEIDLRPYFVAVGRNWKWVVGAAILFALLALVVVMIMPADYRAKALVAVTEPRQVVQFDPRIRTAEENQPIKAYPELATSDELLSLLLQEITPIAPEVDNLAALRGHLAAQAGSDPSLINLSATHGDPQIAAEVVNRWADIFVSKANEVFGVQGDEQLSFFEDQLGVAAQDLQRAEQELIDFQTHNRSMLLENELLALQQTQADQLAKQRQIALLLQETNILHEQLSESSENGNSVANQLAATLLQLRAFGGVPEAEMTTPWQLQINIDQIAVLDEQDQLAFLSSLQESLQAQSEQIDTHLTELEPQILMVQQEKQEAVAEDDRLSRNLIISEESYTALARKVEEGKITSQNSSSGVRLASKSAVPLNPSGPNKILVILIAAFVGMLFGLVAVLAVEWWRD